MKALRLESVGNLRLVDIDVPRPSPGEILVKTGAALICTSDINDLRRNVFKSVEQSLLSTLIFER